MTKTIKTILATTIATITLSTNAEFLLMQPIQTDIAEVMVVESSEPETPARTIPMNWTNIGSDLPVVFTVTDEDLFTSVALPLEVNLTNDGDGTAVINMETGDGEMYQFSGGDVMYHFNLDSNSHTMDLTSTSGFTIEIDYSGGFSFSEWEVE